MTNKDKEILRLYGEFQARFEFVCSRLRFAIGYLLFPDYNDTKRNICEIMTEGLTSDPLRRKFLALVIERYSKQSEIFKSAELISKRFLEVIELRNSFAHGTPFIGEYDFIEETKKGKLVLRHPKIKADGLDLNFKTYNSNSLKELVSFILKIENSIAQVTIVVKHEHLKDEVKKKFHDRVQQNLKSISLKQIMSP